MLSGQSTKINKAASDAIIEAHVVMSFALSPTGRRLAVYSGLLTQHQSNIEVVFGLTNTALEWICSIAHSWLIERSRSLIAATYHWHSLRLHMYTDDCQVYLSTSIEDVPLAVSKFAACVVNISAWLSVCRLRLTAAKTQLLWLGSSQLLVKFDCDDVLVLSMHVAISDTARRSRPRCCHQPWTVASSPCHGCLLLQL